MILYVLIALNSRIPSSSKVCHLSSSFHFVFQLYLDRFHLNLKRTTLPIEEIRNYFGSSIGLYFAFIEFYTKALVFPAVFGILQSLMNLNLSLVCSFYVVWTTVSGQLWISLCISFSSPLFRYFWSCGNVDVLGSPIAGAPLR